MVGIQVTQVSAESVQVVPHDDQIVIDLGIPLCVDMREGAVPVRRQPDYRGQPEERVPHAGEAAVRPARYDRPLTPGLPCVGHDPSELDAAQLHLVRAGSQRLVVQLQLVEDRGGRPRVYLGELLPVLRERLVRGDPVLVSDDPPRPHDARVPGHLRPRLIGERSGQGDPAVPAGR